MIFDFDRIICVNTDEKFQNGNENEPFNGDNLLGLGFEEVKQEDGYFQFSENRVPKESFGQPDDLADNQFPEETIDSWEEMENPTEEEEEEEAVESKYEGYKWDSRESPNLAYEPREEDLLPHLAAIEGEESKKTLQDGEDDQLADSGMIQVNSQKSGDPFDDLGEIINKAESSEKEETIQRDQAENGNMGIVLYEATWVEVNDVSEGQEDTLINVEIMIENGDIYELNDAEETGKKGEEETVNADTPIESEIYSEISEEVADARQQKETPSVISRWVFRAAKVLQSWSGFGFGYF